MSDVQNPNTNTTPNEGNATPSSPTSEQETVAAQEEGQEKTAATPVTRPWYASPWFWGILLFLAILLLLAWIIWHQWQARLALLEQEAVIVLEHEERNDALLAEIARLKALLAKEPCELKTLLLSEGERLQIPQQNKAHGQNPGAAQDAPPVLPQGTEQEPKVQPTTPAEAPPPPATSPAAPSNSNTESGTDMVQNLENATVLVLSDEPNGMQMGTGFFIAPGIVLTNQHVLGTGKGDVYVVGTFKGGAVKAKVLVISPIAARDYAVLQVPVTDVAPLVLNTNVQRTQKVSTWGFPSAVTSNDPKFKALMSGQDTDVPDIIYSEGTVSVVQEKNPELIVHTAIVSQGNSGGPLVNEQGEVIGINTYIHMDKQSYRQSSLSIVAKDIINFLQEHNIPYTSASTNKE